MVSYDKNDNSIIMDMTRNAPRALEEFNKMLDDGLTIDGSTITLDFSKIFVKGTEDSNIDEMMLIEEISSSPFKHTIDHPLIQTFLHDKFRRVKPFYIIIQPCNKLIKILAIWKSSMGRIIGKHQDYA